MKTWIHGRAPVDNSARSSLHPFSWRQARRGECFWKKVHIDFGCVLGKLPLMPPRIDRFSDSHCISDRRSLLRARRTNGRVSCRLLERGWEKEVLEIRHLLLSMLLTRWSTWLANARRPCRLDSTKEFRHALHFLLKIFLSIPYRVLDPALGFVRQPVNHLSKQVLKLTSLTSSIPLYSLQPSALESKTAMTQPSKLWRFDIE